ncbi:MAG: putative membrane protein [Desulfotomaculum sp. 46_296]|nr:MAG: putative membrane protein [Desulfotomaculum sp. 46_296]
MIGDVMIDGALTMPVIHFNQSLNKVPEMPELSCAKDFLDNAAAYLKAYSVILNNKRSDRNYVGLRKKPANTGSQPF